LLCVVILSINSPFPIPSFAMLSVLGSSKRVAVVVMCLAAMSDGARLEAVKAEDLAEGSHDEGLVEDKSNEAHAAAIGSCKGAFIGSCKYVPQGDQISFKVKRGGIYEQLVEDAGQLVLRKLPKTETGKMFKVHESQSDVRRFSVEDLPGTDGIIFVQTEGADSKYLKTSFGSYAVFDDNEPGNSTKVIFSTEKPTQESSHWLLEVEIHDPDCGRYYSYVDKTSSDYVQPKNYQQCKKSIMGCGRGFMGMMTTNCEAKAIVCKWNCKWPEGVRRYGRILVPSIEGNGDSKLTRLTSVDDLGVGRSICELSAIEKGRCPDQIKADPSLVEQDAEVVGSDWHTIMTKIQQDFVNDPVIGDIIRGVSAKSDLNGSPPAGLDEETIAAIHSNFPALNRKRVA